MTRRLSMTRRLGLAALKALIITTAISGLCTFAHEADPTACYTTAADVVFGGPCWEVEL